MKNLEKTTKRILPEIDKVLYYLRRLFQMTPYLSTKYRQYMNRIENESP